MAAGCAVLHSMLQHADLHQALVRMLESMACNFSCTHSLRAAVVTWLAADGRIWSAVCPYVVYAICRAKQHCKLPENLVESLPSEEIYSRYMPGQRNFRVLKRDLGPLLQQVRLMLHHCVKADDACRSLACLTLGSGLHIVRVAASSCAAHSTACSPPAH